MTGVKKRVAKTFKYELARKNTFFCVAHLNFLLHLVAKVGELRIVCHHHVAHGTRRFVKPNSFSFFCCGRSLPLMAKCKCDVCAGQTCTLTVHWHLQFFVTRLCRFAYNLNCYCTCTHCFCFTILNFSGSQLCYTQKV